MLKRLIAAAGVLAMMVVVLVIDANPASADTGAGCTGARCWVVTTGPAVPGTRGGGTGGGGGTQDCFLDHGDAIVSVACWEPAYGFWSNSAECYYMKTTPQPPASDPVWQGHTPAQGAIYTPTCATAGCGYFCLTTVAPTWLAGVPADTARGPSPAQVASEALAQLTVGAPQVGTAPVSVGRGLVGLPVWMWTARNAGTWGPIPVTKTDGPITVNVTANAQYIDWNMGDGDTVRCDNPGSPFDSAATDSPTCGYRYLTASRNQPGGKYTITATTHWQVTWAGGGENGTLTADVASTTTVTIDELQVLTR
jgi:hypothetical protein